MDSVTKQTKATAQSANETTSSAAASAQQTVQDAASKAAPGLLSSDKSHDNKNINPSGKPGQEPLSGEKGTGKNEPFDKGNVGA